MTGQATKNIEHISALAAGGLSRSEIAAKTGLCYGYVARLIRESGLKPPSKKDASLDRIRELARQGRTLAQISETTGINYSYVSRLASISQIEIPRQKYTGAETPDSERVLRMAELYKSGRTLEQIGERFKVSRERVRQILTKHLGFSATSGGKHARAEQRKTRFELKRNQKCLEKWGCSWVQYTELRSLRKPTRAFASQKRNAGVRGIAWDLSLWQWWQIWQQSGHWSDRGRGRGFQMCRIGDQGPYSIDNVYIASGAVNIQDYWAEVKTGARARSVASRARLSPEVSKERLKQAALRYRQTPKYQLRHQLRRQGLPKAQRDAIVAERFGA